MGILSPQDLGGRLVPPPLPLLFPTHPGPRPLPCHPRRRVPRPGRRWSCAIPSPSPRKTIFQIDFVAGNSKVRGLIPHRTSRPDSPARGGGPPADTFRALLAYLTTGQLPSSSDSLLQLLVLVDKYGVTEGPGPPRPPPPLWPRRVGSGRVFLFLLFLSPFSPRKWSLSDGT